MSCDGSALHYRYPQLCEIQRVDNRPRRPYEFTIRISMVTDSYQGMGIPIATYRTNCNVNDTPLVRQPKLRHLRHHERAAFHSQSQHMALHGPKRRNRDPVLRRHIPDHPPPRDGIQLGAEHHEWLSALRDESRRVDDESGF